MSRNGLNGKEAMCPLAVHQKNIVANQMQHDSGILIGVGGRLDGQYPGIQ
jgi:hypothetical protein